MKAGDIVTWSKQDFPREMKGTVDGRAFYKVVGYRGKRIQIQGFYFGKWKRRPGWVGGGRVYNWSPIYVGRRNVRLATSEERVQLALVMFME